MNYIQSKNFSLLCAVLNGSWALLNFFQGDWVMTMIGIALCVFCMNNYRNADS